MHKIQGSKNKIYFENKMSRPIYKNKSFTAIYRENKSSADYVKGGRGGKE
jgi:hypothetical protein